MLKDRHLTLPDVFRPRGPCGPKLQPFCNVTYVTACLNSVNYASLLRPKTKTSIGLLSMMAIDSKNLPGEHFKVQRMPGHWVLARLGKRVLRPGGMRLTRRLLERLNIQPEDAVVEFAPGMGSTAGLTLKLKPASYTAIERDESAAKIVRSYLTGESQRCVLATAESTGLPSGSATVVYGEAMLTMQPDETKRKIVHEAYRILSARGRYAIHEMYLQSDNLEVNARRKTERDLTGVVHHGVRPLSISEWRSLLMSEGFTVQSIDTASMSLLEPARLLRDEGFVGTLRFIWNISRDKEARHRVREMRSVFRRNRKILGALSIIAVKE